MAQPSIATRYRSLAIATSLSLALAAAAQAQAPKAQVIDDDDNVPKAVPVPETPKPTGPDEDLFDYAGLAFTQKEYAMAATSYGQYLSNYGRGRHVPEALFRLGECYMQQGKLADADRYYSEVVNRYPKAEVAPSAAYRLAASHYNAGDFKAAATYFNFCELNTPTERIRIAAAFYKSQAYEMLKEPKKQMEALKTVLAVRKDNDFREKALISMASLLQRDGRNDEAQPILNEIVNNSKDAAVRAEAALKAAVLYSEKKDSDEAIRLYEIALKGEGSSPEAKGAALVGICNELYITGKYDAVIDTYNRNASLLPPNDLRPRLLMHVGNAQRLKKNYAQAIELYGMVERFHAQSELAFEASHWKLLCFYLLDDKKLPELVRAFLDTYAEANPKHEYINKARLLRADYLFNNKVWALAAEAFDQVQVEQLEEKYRASTLFHQGWSQSEAGKHQDAVESFTQYITGYPKETDLPTALAKRGMSYREIKDGAKAVADFNRLITEFPKYEGVELAYYLTGLIHKDSGDKKGMIAAFEALLDKFPRSKAAAEAAYRAGSAYSELSEFDKAVPLLHKAADLDAKSYYDQAYQKLIVCHWARKDADALAKVVDDYRGSNEKAEIPQSALGFLGLTLFGKKDFARAARYFTWASTPDSPASTDPRIWNFLALSQLEAKGYDEAVKAIDHFLAATPNPSNNKAKAYLTKSAALLGKGDTVGAEAAAAEALQFTKQGPIQGELLIAQGDALMVDGDKLETAGDHNAALEKWKAAAAKYIVPSQIIADPEVTPKALTRLIKALTRTGDTAGAQARKDQLAKEYPDFKVEE